MERPEGCNLLNQLETQLKLQDNFISKLQKEQSSKHYFQVRHGNFESSNNKDTEDSKVEKNFRMTKESYLKNGPICYLEKLLESQSVVQCKYATKLDLSIEEYKKSIIKNEHSKSSFQQNVDDNELVIFETVQNRNILKWQLNKLQSENQELENKINFFKNKGTRVKKTKDMLAKLIKYRLETINSLKDNSQNIYNKEIELKKSKKVMEDLKDNLNIKKCESFNGNSVKQLEEQKNDIETIKNKLILIESNNLKLLNKVNSQYETPTKLLPITQHSSNFNITLSLPITTHNLQLISKANFTNNNRQPIKSLHSSAHHSANDVSQEFSSRAITTSKNITSSADNAISTFNTDIQSAIESMQETILFLEKEFDSTNKNSNTANKYVNNFTSHEKDEKLTKVVSPTTTPIMSSIVQPQNFPTIIKTSLKPLTIKLTQSPKQIPCNNELGTNAQGKIFPHKRLITISSPLKPPSHLLPPTKSSF